MRIAPDGSPVEFYLALPPRTEDAALLHDMLPAGATVLDLGCGPGRLSEPLVELGHPVTGVDNEPAMLAALRRTTGVCADITALDLGERFDAVLLMSHFVDTSTDPVVDALLRTVRRHVRDDGVAIIERYEPGWADTITERTSEMGGMRIGLREVHRAGGVLTARYWYEVGEEIVEQPVAARDVNDERLAGLAARAGLRLVRRLNLSGTLVLLRPGCGAEAIPGQFDHPLASAPGGDQDGRNEGHA
jgi:SAM-dependent methyltransferase